MNVCMKIPEMIAGVSLTTANLEHAASRDKISLGFCQRSKCCKTQNLNGEYLQGQTLTINDSLALTNCTQMALDWNEDVHVEIDATSERNNGWKGEKITIISAFGKIMECPFNLGKKWLKNTAGADNIANFEFTCWSPTKIQRGTFLSTL